MNFKSQLLSLITESVSLKRITEGGNLTLTTKSGTHRAEKISFKKLPISKFRDEFTKLFIELNKLFHKKYKYKLWSSDSLIKKAEIFNGSTSFIMDVNLSPDEIFKYKQSSGDVDVVIPKESAKDLHGLLKTLEDKNIGNFTFLGSNRDSDKLGTQIITLFRYNPENIVCQVDFELSTFENGKPTEFTKFSHSSSFEDAKANIKAAFHKLLLRSLVGAISTNPNIVIATRSSTPNNIKLASNSELPREMKFSVDRGLRLCLEPMLDNGKPVFYEGKQVFKEIPTKDSEFITDVSEIFRYIFKSKVNKNDILSFVGVIKLMKKYCDVNTLRLTQERFFDIILSPKAQVIDNDLDIDKQIKISAYEYLLHELKLQHPGLDKDIEKYYAIKSLTKRN